MNEADTNTERALEAKARRLFAESLSGLDGHTRSRLARARAAAVEAASKRCRSVWLTPPRLVPLGGVAAAALAAALIWQGPGTSIRPVEPTLADDLDILVDGEDLELYEDLEFYAWLLDQPELLKADDTADGSG